MYKFSSFKEPPLDILFGSSTKSPCAALSCNQSQSRPAQFLSSKQCLNSGPPYHWGSKEKKYLPIVCNLTRWTTYWIVYWLICSTWNYYLEYFKSPMTNITCILDWTCITLHRIISSPYDWYLKIPLLILQITLDSYKMNLQHDTLNCK